MELEQQVAYLLRHPHTVAIRKPLGGVTYRRNEDTSPVETIGKIEVHEVIRSLVYELEATKKHNSTLRDDFLWCIANSGQLDWNRDLRRHYLVKHFPEAIEKLPFSAGGDL